MIKLQICVWNEIKIEEIVWLVFKSHRHIFLQYEYKNSHPNIRLKLSGFILETNKWHYSKFNKNSPLWKRRTIFRDEIYDAFVVESRSLRCLESLNNQGKEVQSSRSIKRRWSFDIAIVCALFPYNEFLFHTLEEAAWNTVKLLNMSTGQSFYLLSVLFQ